MTASVTERFGWQVGLTSSERLYTVKGEPNAEAAHAAALADVPDEITVDGKDQKLTDVTVEEQGNGLWHARASYARPGSKDPTNEHVPDTSSLSFSTSGSTQHVTQSRGTQSIYYDTSFVSGAVDFMNAINVGANGPEGVDITVPTFNFTVVVNRETCDATYLGKLHHLTGRTNNATFSVVTTDGSAITLAEGECLYLGASGSKRANMPWEITHNFAASPNVTDLTIGGMNAITKKGWEYAWARYKLVEDPVNHEMIHVPVSAYVEKMYWTGDFDDLELP